jgi:hypothetical protein
VDLAEFSNPVRKKFAMPTRPDGYLTKDEMYAQLCLPLDIVDQALAEIHAITRYFPDDPNTECYSPTIIPSIEDWMVDHWIRMKEGIFYGEDFPYNPLEP